MKQCDKCRTVTIEEKDICGDCGGLLITVSDDLPFDWKVSFTREGLIDFLDDFYLHLSSKPSVVLIHKREEEIKHMVNTWVINNSFDE